MVPPHIQIKYFQLKFRFYRAENLPDLDNFVGGGDTDAYVKVDFLGKSIRTKAVSQKDGVAEWLQELWIPAQIPIVSKRIVFRVYDEDTGKDELIGSMTFDLEKYITLA